MLTISPVGDTVRHDQNLTWRIKSWSTDAVDFVKVGKILKTDLSPFPKQPTEKLNILKTVQANARLDVCITLPPKKQP